MDGKRRRITFLYLQFVNVLTCKMIQVGRCERSSSSCHITDTDDLGNFGPPSFRVDLQDAQTPPYMLPSGTWLPRSQPCELSRACARVTDRHTHTHTPTRPLLESLAGPVLAYVNQKRRNRTHHAYRHYVMSKPSSPKISHFWQLAANPSPKV